MSRGNDQYGTHIVGLDIHSGLLRLTLGLRPGSATAYQRLAMTSR